MHSETFQKFFNEGNKQKHLIKFGRKKFEEKKKSKTLDLTFGLFYICCRAFKKVETRN